ncbi:hypothetical protein [Virgibacillus necropolis]|uniref:Uncharacterized protein n=1 Tax=Virgibacillus necropolis TaxID=163877 RepID=A0A221M8D1_9BACI|nr:hypothetical protein [Virgibacillus necropolis]ASN03885.1 hypothetical protein CFK40_02145 [Virgibacillus necropolis]
MKFFLKLNAISALYGFIFFIASELMLNVYRISEITGWELGFVTNVGVAIYIIGFILSTTLFINVRRKWLENRKAIFWSIILWFPYFILFIYLFASLFPITNPANEPNPGVGLIIMGAVIFYPFYLLLINLVGAGIVGKSNGDKL